MSGKKYDQEKPRLDLVPFLGVLEIAKVLTFGAGRYGDNNWQALDNFKPRYLAAAFRHLIAYAMGETHDADSGLSHLAHCATNLLFLIWNDAKDGG